MNPGDDTDTIGAIAGGLAGLFYGYEAFPGEWITVIQSPDQILALCDSVKVTGTRFQAGLSTANLFWLTIRRSFLILYR